LNSTKAVEMSILVVRAFVRFRRLLATHSQLAAKIDELERDRFSRQGRGGLRFLSDRFYFFSREEPRAHVHVQHATGGAKVWLEPVVELAQNHGLGHRQVSTAFQLPPSRRPGRG
jgi:hypothetical protein